MFACSPSPLHFYGHRSSAGLRASCPLSSQVLKAAEARLSSKRCVGITTSSDKFRWSRGVGRFLQVGGHPMGNVELHKEEEALLRRDPVRWKSAEVKVREDGNTISA